MKLIKQILVVLILLVIVAAGIFTGFYFIPQDDAAVEDYDLSFEMQPIDEADNSYDLYMKAALANSEIWDRQDFSPGQALELLTGYTVGEFAAMPESLNKNAVVSIINSEDEVFDTLKDAEKLPEFRKPSYENPENFVDAFEPVQPGLLPLARAIRIKSILDFEKNDMAAATSDIKSILTLGTKVDGSITSLIDFLVALEIKREGLKSIHYLAVNADMANREIYGLFNLVKDLKTGSDTFTGALKGEYRNAAIGIDEFRKTEAEGWVEKYLMGSSYHFKPIKTKNTLAAVYAEILEEAHADICNVSDKKFENPPAGLWDILITENSYGKNILSVFNLLFSNAASAQCSFNIYTDMVGTMLALRLYQNDRESLPENLSDLVPDYLEQVPVDPFGGDGLKYDPEKMIIYSVGNDLEDAGGMDAGEDNFLQILDDGDFMKEPTLYFGNRLPYKAPAPTIKVPRTVNE